MPSTPAGRKRFHTDPSLRQVYVKDRTGEWLIRQIQGNRAVHTRSAKPNEVVIIERLFAVSERDRAPGRTGGWLPPSRQPQIPPGASYVRALVCLSTGSVIEAWYHGELVLWTTPGLSPICGVVAWQSLPKWADLSSGEVKSSPGTKGTKCVSTQTR